MGLLVQFFAGSCLVANGAYIGAGSFRRIGDAGDLLRQGSPIWSLWLFGIITIPLGLYLWNGLAQLWHWKAGKWIVLQRIFHVPCFC